MIHTSVCVCGIFDDIKPSFGGGGAFIHFLEYVKLFSVMLGVLLKAYNFLWCECCHV